jgi:hypothetical protein
MGPPTRRKYTENHHVLVNIFACTLCEGYLQTLSGVTVSLYLRDVLLALGCTITLTLLTHKQVSRSNETTSPCASWEYRTSPCNFNQFQISDVKSIRNL